MFGLIKFFLCFLALTFYINNPAAANYCWHPYSTVQNGGVTTIEWKMTSSSTRRVIPPNEKVLEWCAADWSALGAHYQPVEIVTKPRLNEARVTNYYRLHYHPKKAGTDELVVKIHWLSRTNDKWTGTIIYKITVVDGEL